MVWQLVSDISFYLIGARHKGHPIISITSTGLGVLEGEGSVADFEITMKYFSSLIE